MSKFWILTQIYGRHEIAKESLANLKETAPAHAEIHIWQDNPQEDCEWAKAFGTLHKLGRNMGIDALRTTQLNKAILAKVDEIYMTDTDAIHDPNWYQEILRLSKFAPLAGVYNTRHHDNWIETHPDYHVTPAIPGISVYLTGKTLRKCATTLSLGVMRSWDFSLPSLLGNRCAISATSHVEHLGGGGLHNTTFEADVAMAPTTFLVKERQRILPNIQPKSYREIIEASPPTTVILNQPHGLGDIIMIEPIARWIQSFGHTVVWPYNPCFGNLQKHVDCATMVPMQLMSKDFDSPSPTSPKGSIVIPIRFSQGIMGYPYEGCMKSKYAMFGLDWRDWSSARWNRDLDAEARLMAHLGIKRGDKYVIVNDTYHTSRACKISIPNVKGINLEPIDGFTLIDWSGVFENATEIHSVGTSLQYVVELTNTKAKLFMYPRVGEKDCSAYDYLFKKPWTQIL